MLRGLRMCVEKGLNKIIKEADSKLLMSCVNEETESPWRMLQIIEEIKEIVNNKGVVLMHYYRKANTVADKLATLSHKHHQSLVFTRFEDPPRMVRGLMSLDKWEMTSFRIRQLKPTEIQFELP